MCINFVKNKDNRDRLKILILWFKRESEKEPRNQKRNIVLVMKKHSLMTALTFQHLRVQKWLMTHIYAADP